MSAVGGTHYVRFFREKEFIGFKVVDGVVSNITDRSEFNGKNVWLYDKNHVAPAKRASSIIETQVIDKKIRVNSGVVKRAEGQYRMSKKENSKIKVIENILGYDIETYTDENHKSVVYCICLSSGQSFYGTNCVSLFIDYLDTLKQVSNVSKTNSKVAKKRYLIYGFNCARFDNCFIYEELKRRDKNTKMIIVGSSIKSITYHNIDILDLSLYYAGTLKKVASDFKITTEKGVFPYTFVNKDNLYYKGPTPDAKYWNEGDLAEYDGIDSKLYFDMEAYSIKYCLLDAKIAQQIGQKHCDESTGEINGRKYDVRMKITAASQAMSMYQQCFQEDDLFASDETHQQHERDAYFGGRCEVFKKEFNQDLYPDQVLNEFDINSSYPASMTKLMPYKQVGNTLPANDDDEIIPYYNYYCQVSYDGSDKQYIPNILSRVDGIGSIALKNSTWGWRWGCELLEAIKDGCSVKLKHYDRYEARSLFKEFSEYFYSERLKVKASHPSKAAFFKIIMNSFYGKFGQKDHTATVLCNSSDEIDQVLSRKNCKLISFDKVGDSIVLEYSDDETNKESPGQLVRFASYIASESRCNLARMMREVGHQNVWYCDTDSVYTTKFPTKMIDNHKLGWWKHEGSMIKAQFLAPKSYNKVKLDGSTEYKAKGHRKCDMNMAVSQLAFELGNLSEPQAVEVINPTMFHRSLKGIVIKPQVRKLETVYNKRIWHGNDSEAYDMIDEWKENLDLQKEYRKNRE